MCCTSSEQKTGGTVEFAGSHFSVECWYFTLVSKLSAALNPNPFSALALSHRSLATQRCLFKHPFMSVRNLIYLLSTFVKAECVLIPSWLSQRAVVVVVSDLCWMVWGSSFLSLSEPTVLILTVLMYSSICGDLGTVTLLSSGNSRKKKEIVSHRKESGVLIYVLKKGLLIPNLGIVQVGS